MNFNDFYTKICPLCEDKVGLGEAQCNVGKKFVCRKESYNINQTWFNHYEIILYRDYDDVLLQFIIPPIQVYSCKGESTIHMIIPINKYFYGIKNITERASSLLITKDNVQEIMKKLKLYMIFL
jgi:hypothetical protein